MADLSSLSDEQLQAYKRLLFRKSSADQELKGPPKMTVALPEGMQNKEETLKEQWNPKSSKFWIPEEFRKDIPDGMAAIAAGRYAPGISELIQGGKRAVAPVVAGATLANPLAMAARAIPAIGGSMLAQKGAEKGAALLGANPEQQEATGEVASLVPFGGLESERLGNTFAGAVKGGANAAMKTLSSPRNALKGAGLYYLGRAAGEAAGNPYAGEAIAEGLGFGLPIAKGMVKGGMKGFKVKSPGSPPIAHPTKGLSLGQMQDAVKSGHMDIGDFETNVSKMGYSPEDAKILSRSLTSKIKPPQSKLPTHTQMSNSQFEQAVMNGNKTMEEYENFLTRKRMVPEDVKTVTDNLQKKIDSAKKKNEEE